MNPGGRGRTQVAYAWLRARPFVVDALAAAGLAVLTVVLAAFAVGSVAWLGLLMVVPLAWRRVRPVASAAGVAAGAFVQVTVSASPLVVDVAVPVALFSVVAYGSRRAAAAFIGVAVVGAVLAGFRWGEPGGPRGVAAVTVVCLVGAMAAAAAGEVRRLGRLHEASVIDRARQAEIERAQEARLAAASERARIAREMHDVVAHSLAVMIAQADGARYTTDPAAAATAMGTVAGTGRRALADMRGLLGVLRDGVATGPLPQPGVADVAALVEAVRASGLRVTHQTVGPVPARLGDTWELTVYRVVQESLTNVMKHAGPTARATVALRWGTDALTVRVEDDGPASATDGGREPGTGLEGMRERAVTQRGSLVAGPRPGGGWRVECRLPYPAGTPDAAGHVEVDEAVA